MSQRSPWRRLARLLSPTPRRRPSAPPPTLDTLESRLAPAAVVRSGAALDAASLRPLVDQFRGDLGGSANANVAGSFLSGRREINWDGVGDALAAPNALPAAFFNTTSPRGVVFTTPGSGFLVSADSNNPSGTPVKFSDLGPAYATSFAFFSPERLFAPVGSTVTDVSFFVPGTNFAATVNGFGAVFTDVDSASATTVECFRANGGSLGLFTVQPLNNGLSFLGVSFNAGERVARVRITTGNAALGAADLDGNGSTSDVVVMDDFVYGEPRPVPDLYTIEGPRTLVRFSAGAPGNVKQRISLLGFEVGESLVALDARPATGELYGLTFGGGFARLVRIDPAAGRLVQVGAQFALPGSDFGFDFNPTNDRIRLVSNTGLNLVLHPDTGAVTTQTPLNPGTPSVIAAAYTNSLPGATATTLFGIDAATDRLVRQEPPASGTLTTVGPLGVDAPGSASFDIEGGTNTAYAIFDVGGVSQLYTIDPLLGAASLVGAVGGGLTVRGLAVAPPPYVRISTATPSVVEGNVGAASVSADVALTGDTTGLGPITVRVAAVSDTATVGSDVAALSQTLTFTGPGTQTVTTDVLGEADFEPDEAFAFQVGSVTGAVVAGGRAAVTIENDDDIPSIRISDTTLTEGNTGNPTPTVTLTLSARSTQPITVEAVTLSDTATSGEDFLSLGVATITFDPGVTSRALVLTVRGDTRLEGDESFRVQLSDPGNATLADAEGVVTIRDDDLTLPRPEGTPEERYVTQLYRELLRREPDEDGLRYFVGTLTDRLLNRPGVAAVMQSSPEYRGLALDDLYRRYLGRGLDDTGREGWLAFLGAGGTLDDVTVNLLSSEEYYQLAGATDGRFVDRLYRDILRRRSDLPGRAFWIDHLTKGIFDHIGVAQLILNSREGHRLEVDDVFNSVLRRKPDADTRLSLARLLDAGLPQEIARALVIGSDEYDSRFCR